MGACLTKSKAAASEHITKQKSVPMITIGAKMSTPYGETKEITYEVKSI